MKTKIPKIAFLLILVGIFLLPIIMNCLLLLPTPFNLKTIGSEVEWLSFWGTYLGGIMGACVSFTILYMTLIHNRKEAEVERTNNRLLQLKKDLSERLSDINYMQLNINISKDTDISSEINRLNVLFGKYQQKLYTAKFVYENDENKLAKQFYEAYSNFILLYCQMINCFKQILMSGNDKEEMQRLISEQLNKLSISQLASFKLVNMAALDYYKSEEDRLIFLKTSFL